MSDKTKNVVTRRNAMSSTICSGVGAVLASSLTSGSNIFAETKPSKAISALGYGTKGARSALVRFDFDRRVVGPTDV